MAADPIRVFNIPAYDPFVDALAHGIVARFGGADPLALSRVEILVPTRRAQRAVAQAFLRQSDGRPVILPRLTPVGDVDEDELDIAAGAAGLGLPPAIAPLRRRLALARLVAQWGAGQGDDGIAVDQAVRLAGQLAELLDHVQAERLSFDNLTDLVPDDYAVHWQEVLGFLRIVTEYWPAVLAELGAMDPVARRNALVAARIAGWQASPPDHPVIAAGSTGSVPATADLLDAITALPQGAVVLPGLDTALDEASWRALEPAHPQYGLARLLDRLSVGRADVALWRPEAPPLVGPSPTAIARQAFLTESLRPAATTAEWTKLAPMPATALDQVTYVPCPGSREEATVIALILREVLERRDPPRTGALITPDRGLARRVAAELRRWGVAVDDSAGVPLRQTPPAAFLRLAIDAVAEQFAPVPLLALFKHPLAAAGVDTGAFRTLARDLEILVLRGPRPGPGIAGLIAALEAASATRGRKDRAERVSAWLDRVAGLATTLTELFDAENAPPAALLDAHLRFAEAMADTPQRPGAARLWAGDAGEAAASLMADLADAVVDMPDIAPRRYPALFDALLDGSAVRPRHGGHPRVAILGLLEARLQRFDVTILGGLNEGVWPPGPTADPWMSRQMRHDFGLPDVDRRIGLAAHDFVQACASPVVVLTRAARVDGTPTVPARWLTRMRHVARQADIDFAEADDWRHWQLWLDRVDPSPLAPRDPRPAPVPPVEVRPRRLPVTDVQRWMRNPYAIFARRILNLRRFDPLDQPPTAAHYGSVIHDVLDAFVREFPVAPGTVLGEPAERRLMALGEAGFAPYAKHPTVRAFWWPRFQRIARWFIRNENHRRAELAATGTELDGQLVIDAPRGPFTLTAIADRIDTLPDGRLVIIDYKTGQHPRDPDVEAGFEPQLSLEAAIAAAGGFDGVAPASVAALQYWTLRGGDPAGQVNEVKRDPEALRRDAVAGVRELVALFDDPATPYECIPRDAAAPRFDDYAHLARVKEWSGL